MRLDVLHSPDFIPPPLRNCRSVITIHDLVFLLYPHFLTKDAARYYGQIDEAVRRTDAIIAVSEATKKDIVRLLGVPERKVHGHLRGGRARASAAMRPPEAHAAGARAGSACAVSSFFSSAPSSRARTCPPC